MSDYLLAKLFTLGPTLGTSLLHCCCSLALQCTQKQEEVTNAISASDSFNFSYLIGQQGILPSPWIMGVRVWGVLPAASLSVVDLAHSRPGPS